MDNLMWNNSKGGGKILIFSIAVLAALWVIVPFVWAIINSFKKLRRDLHGRRHHSLS